VTGSAAHALVRRWRGFWFAEIDGGGLACVRIAFGFVLLAWALTLAPDLGAFFSRNGITSAAPSGAPWWEWSVFSLSDSDFAVGAVYVALVAGAGALLVGWHSRLSAAVVFVALTSLMRRTPYVFNSGDGLLRLIAFYLLLAPPVRWSLDRRRARSVVPAWPLRLLQIQLTVIYLGAVTSKLRGASWRDGTAVSYALGLSDLRRVPAPDVLLHSPVAVAIATYGIVLAEAALAVLIWPRRTRVAALSAGVVLHLSIDALLRVGFFSVAVMVLYLSFLKPSRVRAPAGVVISRLRLIGLSHQAHEPAPDVVSAREQTGAAR
jgi:hypothetical protein